MTEAEGRAAIVRAGAHLAARGLAPGTSGNVSVKLESGFLVTPTNASLGALDAEALSLLDAAGEHIGGDRPTKEAALHLAVYRVRPSAGSVVHLHAPYSVALSCLQHADERDVLPKLTPYAVMRLGALALVPYAPPGDRALADAVGALAANYHALLLANHGPVIAGSSLDAAVAGSEELEEVARLSFVLHGRSVRELSANEVDTLRAAHQLR
ncbi:MAG: aldolase [Candidatus Eremiobacteraeota bacterium]|nr:aldolase [Candidatus Eremiobacteraeota bacterium]